MLSMWWIVQVALALGSHCDTVPLAWRIVVYRKRSVEVPNSAVFQTAQVSFSFRKKSKKDRLEFSFDSDTSFRSLPNRLNKVKIPS